MEKENSSTSMETNTLDPSKKKLMEKENLFGLMVPSTLEFSSMEHLKRIRVRLRKREN
jgi:hypothetical protein